MAHPTTSQRGMIADLNGGGLKIFDARLGGRNMLP